MPKISDDSYHPEDYTAEVEEFEPTGDIETIRRDIWGQFEPTFYQHEWYEHFTQRGEDNQLQTHLEGTAIIHRRAGKTVGVFKCVLLPWMLEKRGLYLHVFPTLTQGRAAIWNGQGKVTRNTSEQAIPYLELIPKELWKKKNNAEMSLELVNGSVYRVVGAVGKDGTGDHLRGLNAIGIVPDEYPKWKRDIVSEIFSPMIAQNGGFIFKVGTPYGEGHGYEDYLFAKQRAETDSKVKSWLYTIDDTYYNDGSRIVSQEFVDRELARGVDPEVIKQEYYCDFRATTSAAYYKNQMSRTHDEGRITKVPYDPAYPVFSFWDLGKNGTNARWDFQFPDQHKIHAIGYDCDPELSLYEMHLKSYKSCDYVIDKHYYPWDGNSPESTGMTKLEFVRSKKIKDDIEVIPRSGTAAEGVEFAKALFNKCWFDESRCHFGIQALKNYQKQQSATTGNFGDPLKNKFIHGADAFRTMATAYTKGLVPIGKPRGRAEMLELQTEVVYDEFQL